MRRCKCCDQPIRFGQRKLTVEEKRRYDWRPSGERPNIIEAQCVKAIAGYYGVSDWMSHWDSHLSIRENEEIMRRVGTEGQAAPTMRQLAEFRP